MRRLILLAALAGAAFAQTSNYPGTLDTPSTLFVTADNVQTTLSSPMAIGDSVAVVTSPAGFAANQIATICDAVSKTGVCTTWEHLKITNVAGNVLTVTRGFAGSFARQHAQKASIALLIDAAHQQVLADAITKIETLLGPNMANVASSPLVSAPRYDFAPQAPGGSLIAGANTITLAPVPLGVNGTDTNHPLWVSGGTGAAEACTISGGSGTSGQPSGQIIITCSNPHSGAWTIQSATAGGAEAYWSQGGTATAGVQILYPGGLYHMQAPLTIGGSNACVVGGGKTATTLVQDTANVDGVQFTAGSLQTGNCIRDMQIALQASSTSGQALLVNQQSYFTASDLLLYNVPSGVNLTNSVWATIRHVAVANINAGNGLIIGAGNNNTVLVDRFTVTSGTACNAGIRMLASGDTQIRESELVNCTYGLEMQPGNGQSIASTAIAGTYFDHTSSHGWYIHGAAGSEIYKSRCDQCWFSGSGDGFRVDNSGGTVQGVSIVNSQLLDSAGNGAQINAGSTYLFEANRIANNNNSSGIILGIAVPKFIAIGNIIGNNIDGTGVGTQQYGIYAGAGLGAGTRIDNIPGGNTVADLFLPAGSYTGVSISGPGYEDNAQTIASGTTVAPNPSWSPILKLTGTTTVTTLTAATWPGRKVTIYKTDAGSLTVGGGGNIPLAHTVASNASLILTWDGTAWY